MNVTETENNEPPSGPPQSPFASVLTAFGKSWDRRVEFVGVHICLRVAAFALITPLLAGLINLAVSLSSQSALTDQDIARFALSPAGFVITVLVLSALLVAEVLGFSAMTALFRVKAADRWTAARTALFTVFGKLGTLAHFAVLLVLRVLALALPFVGAGLLVAWQLLTEYDINYYLTERPPEAMLAAGLIAAIVLMMCVVLLVRLSSWAEALPLVLFNAVTPSASFGESAARMRGRRVRFQIQAAIWLLLRLVAALVIGACARAAIELLGFGEGMGLRLVLALIIVLVLLWALAAEVLAAISLGALAWIVEGLSPGDDQPVPAPAIGQSGSRGRLVGAGVAVAVVVFGAFWAAAQMMDAVQTEDDVQIIAHRGAAGSRPENTMASIRKAIEDGTDWVEIDVQETADDQILVAHDSDFMKLAGVNLKVWDATMEDVADIDIGSWFDPEYASERAPLLRDVLNEAKGKARVLIELKYYGHDKNLESRVTAIVEELGMADQIATMSLKYPAVQKMKALRPDWPSGVLAATAVGDLAGLEGDFMAVKSSLATARLVNQIDAADKDLFVWTVNDPLEMSKMISMGVDGLITDEPALARHVLEVRAGLNTGERLMLWIVQELGLSLSKTEYRDNEP